MGDCVSERPGRLDGKSRTARLRYAVLRVHYAAMVRFQPPSTVQSSSYDEDEDEDRSAMSSEAEERTDEFDTNSGSRRRAAASRPVRATKDAPNSAGRHRFAAPQLDDDDEDTDEEQQLNDTRREDEDAEGDDAYEHKYDGRPTGKHSSVYPLISARAERQMSERKSTARRIPMDDAESADEDGVYQQQRERYSQSRERSSSTARNDRPAGAASRKRFVAQPDDEDEQLIDQPQPNSTAPFPFLTDSSLPAYLVTPSLLFTPGSHTTPSADPALLLSQLMASLPQPPASTTSSASSLPGVTDHFPRPRRAFGAGWGVDGKVTVIRGSSVTVTRVKGDEQNSDRTADEADRERQGRVAMMLAMLQVHHQFAEAQRQPQLALSTPSSTTIVSSSSIALLCDRYIAALSALSMSYPPVNAASSTFSLIPAHSFSVASQLRHAISVFQLVKVLYAPEYGSASLASFLSTPSSSTPSPSPSLSFDFPLQSLSPAADLFGEVYARLHQLKQYFKQQLTSLAPAPTLLAATSATPAIFSLLSSYQVTEATELALSSRHLRLATLLPSLSSVTADLTAMCASQVAEWQNSGVWDVMAEEERQCFLLLAGHKQADDMHWLRGLAMYVCYQTEGDASVTNGLKEYVRAVEDGNAKPSLPPYKYEPHLQRKERRRIMDDDDEADQLPMTDQRRQARQIHFDTRSGEQLHTHTQCMQPACDDRHFAVTELTQC